MPRETQAGWPAHTGHPHPPQHTGTERRICLRGPREHHGHRDTHLSEQGTGMQRDMQSEAAPCSCGRPARRPRSPLKHSCLNKCWRHSAAQIQSWMNPTGVTPVLMVLQALEGKSVIVKPLRINSRKQTSSYRKNSQKGKKKCKGVKLHPS